MLNHIKQITGLLLLTFVISSCSIYQVTSKDVSTDVYPSKASFEDVAYLEKVDRPYDVIGYVTVNTERRNQEMQDILKQMRKEAAVLGGDAITNIRTDAGTGKWAQIKPKQLFGNANIRENFIATVIVFKDKS